MREAGVGCLVVVDEAQRPVGMLTDRDVVLAAIGRRLEPAKTSVRDVMHESVVTVTGGAPLGVAIRFMRQYRLRRIPIVDKETGKLAGIVTLDDVVQLLADELSGIAELLSLQNPSRGDGRVAAVPDPVPDAVRVAEGD
jgi:predicted transcriptional regulator